MNKIGLITTLVGISLLGACSAANPPPTSGNDAGGTASAGASGNVGTSGSAGASGNLATSGSAGASGSAGTSGNAGASGSLGTSGNAGASGSLGTSGNAGVSGSVGTSGSAGASGSLGTSGAAGASGGAGASGSGVGGSATAGGAGVSGGGSAGVGGSAGSGGSGTHWVGTWTASPYLAASDAQPPASLTNAVLRQVTHVSLGGSQIRVQFSNAVGNGSLAIKSAHVAICKATPAVDGSIDTTTDKALSFSGMAAVTIAQGQEIWSDPLDFNLPALANVTLTLALGNVPSNLTAHAGSRTTSYVQTGSTTVNAANLTSAQKTDHWYFIAGIDVMADASAKAAVAIGDSITDGRGTDTNMNNRWTDVLASRLHGSAATANVAMMNQGIGATNLVGSGTAAQARFKRDVLGQSGVKYAIVFDGVNDIGGGASFQSMQTVYQQMISAAHAQGVLIYGATILPFSGNAYYSVAHESVRQQVNSYVRSGAFDGYIDFDAALTDGGNPPALQAVYATWSQQDFLHPGPAGYQKMGNSVDLALFTK